MIGVIDWSQACDLQFEEVFFGKNFSTQITNHKPDPNFKPQVGF